MSNATSSVRKTFGAELSPDGTGTASERLAQTQGAEVARISTGPKAGVALNSFWNLLGQSSPLLLAALAIPVLIRQLGLDRFGVLTLAWILVGYFSLFDLGIGRAITKLLAERMALGDSESARNLIWTAIFSMVLLGVCFGGLLLALAAWLSHSALKIPLSLQKETFRSFALLAAAVPFVTLTCGLRGMLEAQQSFGVVNALRIGLGFVTYLGPLTVLPFSRNLVPVVLTLVLARVLSCGFHFLLCKRYIPMFGTFVAWDHKSFAHLLTFGSWLTVSNIISPIMVYLDRFLIGSLISISAVTYYTTPFELVTKLWVVPSALAGVLFPAFSETLVVKNHDRANLLYESGVGSVLVILFPIILFVVLFASEGLQFWLGAEFAKRSSGILQILAIGVFVNSLANIPFALLQASGRPDLTAKLHLIEVPCYVALLYLAIRMRGNGGAAIAWTFRLCAEAVILFLLSRWIVKRPLAARLILAVLLGAAALVTAAFITGLLLKLSFFVVMLAVFTYVAWYWVLNDFQRVRLRSSIKAVPLLG